MLGKRAVKLLPEVAALTTFAEVVRARAGDGKARVVFGDEQWTWAEVVQEGADRAAALAGMRGEGPPPHIGILLENVPDYLFWTCAAALSGCVLVGVNPTRRGQELAADIRHTGCRVRHSGAADINGWETGALNLPCHGRVRYAGQHYGALGNQLTEPRWFGLRCHLEDSSVI